ncbi:DUF2239 family protein [Cupriavidus basilensis]|uniref:DUF2239 family protein n=1 Tax=Cupriavidus basilensis TaxID=68895 RepID=UPI000751291B|nr:DUF2239 family protein [Cupriavidus basilensis]
MSENQPVQYTAFEGSRRIAAGPLAQVARQVRQRFADQPVAGVLIFCDDDCQQAEVDFRGSAAEVAARIAAAEQAASAVATTVTAVAPADEAGAPRGPGRPRLGVVAREVTLLPRHWEWLGAQPGGASVVLRKLVDEARRAGAGKDRIRHAQEAGYRFMAAAAGGEANFEEVARALFAGDRARFDQMLAPWPADLRGYLAQRAEAAFAGE